MKLYNLFNDEIIKKIKENSIVLFIVCFILIIMGIVFMLLVEGGISIFIVFSTMSIIIYFSYWIYYRKYLIKFKITDNIIQTYLFGKLQKTYYINNMNYTKEDIVIWKKTRGQEQIISLCLIFYNNMNVYPLMEYQSYWNDSDILIVQNKEIMGKLYEE